jgi:hypothetical protein
MRRLILCIAATIALCAGNACCDDFLLRLEAIGYVDHPAAAGEPEEKLLHSIEVVARTQLPFHARVKTGAETLSFRGELRPKEDGSFLVDFSYEHVVDTGMTVPTTSGERKPVLKETSMSSTASLTPDLATRVSGVSTKTETKPVGQEDVVVKSQVRYEITLTKWKTE